MERYHILLPGLKFQEVGDFKQASRRICARVLQDTRDWQIGHTKVFLKVGKNPYTLCSISPPSHHVPLTPPPPPPPTQDQDDQYLEEERDRVLTGFVILIQKWVRGYFQRKRYRAMKGAVLILQKNYRRHYWMKRYRIVSYVVTMVIYDAFVSYELGGSWSPWLLRSQLPME